MDNGIVIKYTGWCPSLESRSVGEHKSHFTMVEKDDISIQGGAPQLCLLVYKPHEY